MDEIKGLELYIAAGVGLVMIWLIVNTVQFYKSEKRKIKHLHRFASEGEVEAQQQLARRYQKGNMVKQSCQKAAFWYQKAAFSGDQEARGHLEQFSKQHKNNKKC